MSPCYVFPGHGNCRAPEPARAARDFAWSASRSNSLKSIQLPVMEAAYLLVMLVRIRHLVEARSIWWCLAGMLLVAAQPLIGTHFCHDGLENEGEIHIRGAGPAIELEVEDDANGPTEPEATFFLPSAASIDLPGALEQGIERLLALVLLLVPLVVPSAPCLSAFQNADRQRAPVKGGAPPPSAVPWRGPPPETAPPFPN